MQLRKLFPQKGVWNAILAIPRLIKRGLDICASKLVAAFVAAILGICTVVKFTWPVVGFLLVMGGCCMVITREATLFHRSIIGNRVTVMHKAMCDDTMVFEGKSPNGTELFKMCSVQEWKLPDKYSKGIANDKEIRCLAFDKLCTNTTYFVIYGVIDGRNVVLDIKDKP